MLKLMFWQYLDLPYRYDEFWKNSRGRCVGAVRPNFGLVFALFTEIYAPIDFFERNEIYYSSSFTNDHHPSYLAAYNELERTATRNGGGSAAAYLRSAPFEMALALKTSSEGDPFAAARRLDVFSAARRVPLPSAAQIYRLSYEQAEKLKEVFDAYMDVWPVEARVTMGQKYRTNSAAAKAVYYYHDNGELLEIACNVPAVFRALFGLYAKRYGENLHETAPVHDRRNEEEEDGGFRSPDDVLSTILGLLVEQPPPPEPPSTATTTNDRLDSGFHRFTRNGDICCIAKNVVVTVAGFTPSGKPCKRLGQNRLFNTTFVQENVKYPTLTASKYKSIRKRPGSLRMNVNYAGSLIGFVNAGARLRRDMKGDLKTSRPNRVSNICVINQNIPVALNPSAETSGEFSLDHFPGAEIHVGEGHRVIRFPTNFNVYSQKGRVLKLSTKLLYDRYSSLPAREFNATLARKKADFDESRGEASDRSANVIAIVTALLGSEADWDFVTRNCLFSRALTASSGSFTQSNHAWSKSKMRLSLAENAKSLRHQLARCPSVADIGRSLREKAWHGQKNIVDLAWPGSQIK